MAKVIIPTPLRKFTNNESTFLSEGIAVKNVIQDLVTKNPNLSKHILTTNGDLRSFIRVYVGDEDIHALQGEDTAVSAETVISIVPAIAGGI